VVWVGHLQQQQQQKHKNNDCERANKRRAAAAARRRRRQQVFNLIRARPSQLALGMVSSRAQASANNVARYASKREFHFQLAFLS
jgi:hypothetical protein